MGAASYTSWGDWWGVNPENDPPICVFPHACAQHVASGYEEQCEACQVFRWYQHQQKHIRAMAVARIREVSVEPGCESKLSRSMESVASMLAEKKMSKQR